LRGSVTDRLIAMIETNSSRSCPVARSK